MKISIPYEAMTDAIKRDFGVDGWRGTLDLDLTRLQPDVIDRIEKTLLEIKSKRGVTKSLRTITAFKKLTVLAPDAACAKAKSIEPYFYAMRKLIAALPSKRIYAFDGDLVEGYYMEKMTFARRERVAHGNPKSEDYWVEMRPAYIVLLLCYIDDRGLQREQVTFRETELYGKHPFVVLSERGYHLETPELKQQMLRDRSLWWKTRETVGMQFLAVGDATVIDHDPADDGDDDDDDDRRRWRRYAFDTRTVRVDKEGPANVVVDIETAAGLRELKLGEFESGKFWTANDQSEVERNLFKKQKADEDETEVDDDDSYLDDDDADDSDAPPSTGLVLDNAKPYEMGPLAELPVHPYVTAFDLRKHHRIRIHMAQLTEYKYDVGMRDKLVIDPASRMLIEMLLYRRAEFKDVIAKKGGGAVILCAGPPGVGKTLTSEVFAEVEKRPLYSVQCSQLGTSAEELEKALMLIFARAIRWRAILLLDEADVYIAKRGTDMNQNAIVGVFLRVLEYYNGVMFMTTNRAESVDDAVLSRCVARIDYTLPSPEEQVRIWRILAANAGLTLAPGAAEEISQKYRLSGRDVKQILKLAELVAYARKQTAIDVATIQYCMQFKPTEKVDTK